MKKTIRCKAGYACAHYNKKTQSCDCEEITLNILGACDQWGLAEKIRVMQVKLDKGAIMPRREHETDAGYDLFTPCKFILPANGISHIDTGVHIQLPPGKCALVFSKSGLLKNHGVLSMGLVDEGYTGSIGVTLVNLTTTPIKFAKGEKISQFFITNYFGYDLEETEALEETDRGEAGFGSTGR